MRRSIEAFNQHKPGEQPLPWKEPSDFCFAPPWPKQAQGPMPIKNPVQHSNNFQMVNSVQSNAVNSRKDMPTSVAGGLKKMMTEGATRGQSEALLMCTYAAKKEQSEIATLLKSGADPNCFAKVDWQPNFETTPLLEAAVNGHKRIVRLLLEHGGKPDTIVGPGFTAMYNACMNGHYHVVLMLLDHGARVDILTDEGFSPLYIAAQNGNMDELVACLGASTMTKELADLGPPELGGATALYIAVQNGHPMCVRELLKAGVNVDPQTDAGSTPLMIAMYLADELGDKPHIDCADLLLKAGASTTIKDKAGKNALDWAGIDNSLIAMIKDEEELRERKSKEGRRGFW